jgi:uracil-DNA glycosylase
MFSPQLAPSPGGILFIGGSSGDEDWIKGWPLVGSDGHLFSHALRAAGMTLPGDWPQGFAPGQRAETKRLLWERRQHSFTSVFDLQVPDIRDLCWSAKDQEGYDEGGVSPEHWIPGLPRITGSGYLRPEHHYHLKRLREEILQCRPNLIVPLGGLALWALTGFAETDTYRGAVNVSTRLVPGIKLLPTYAPSHVLQQYKMLMVLISDLVKAKREAAYPEVRLAQREIWLEPTLEDLQRFRTEFVKPDIGPLSIDIETGGGQISCISFSPTAYQSLIVPFVDYRKPNRSYWATERDESLAWQFCAEVLASAVEKLFQNGGSYDIFWFLDRAGLPVANYRHDLRLVHQTLYPELPKSLKFMGATWTDNVAWKAGVHHQHQEDKRDA